MQLPIWPGFLSVVDILLFAFLPLIYSCSHCNLIPLLLSGIFEPSIYRFVYKYFQRQIFISNIAFDNGRKLAHKFLEGELITKLLYKEKPSGRPFHIIFGRADEYILSSQKLFFETGD